MTNVIKCIERPGREGELATGDGGSRRRVFMAICDTKLGTPEIVTAHPKIPRPYSLYQSGTASLRTYVVTGYDVRQYDNNPYAWEVAVKYEPLGQPGDEDQQDPTGRPPKYTWGSWEEREVKKTDLDGQLFRNTANQPLDEAPEFDRRHSMLTIVRAERTFNPQVADFFRNTVCLHAFATYAGGCACMWDITAAYEFDSELGIYFAWVTYEIRFRNVETNPLDNWKWRPRNCGFEYKETAASTKVVNFEDLGGIQVTSPRDLAQDGTKLPDNADPIYLRFAIRPLVPWFALGL